MGNGKKRSLLTADGVCCCCSLSSPFSLECACVRARERESMRVNVCKCESRIYYLLKTYTHAHTHTHTRESVTIVWNAIHFWVCTSNYDSYNFVDLRTRKKQVNTKICQMLLKNLYFERLFFEVFIVKIASLKKQI